MKRQSGLPEKNKLQFVRLLGIESRDHKVILIDNTHNGYESE